MSVSTVKSKPYQVQMPSAQSEMSEITPNQSPVSSPKSKEYCVQDTMVLNGYTNLMKYSKTLQGSVWKAKNKHNKPVFIKVTLQSLHRKSVALIAGKTHSVKENILKECDILKYLTANQPPASLAKYFDFFVDKFNYFLVTEDGGSGLFQFVRKAHKMIKYNALTIKEWQRFCKIAIKQIVDLLDWMHNTMHCVHLDISLENFVISDVMIEVDAEDGVKFVRDFQIKIIDFGLSEIFTDGNFECAKYVGKTPYKAPKVYAKKEPFDARAADTWSFGVVIFAMIAGAFPYTRASKNDPCFQYIISGHLLDLINACNQGSYFTCSILDLVSKIFNSQQNGLMIGDIKKHKWFMD